ncbi:SERTA domain-containing protein 2 taranis [Lycorma delicatula]|uniref:SERTA domain-containing protein 2 taranis n=1 Tax=Lycorma delicatula TaxID=130591 RepID=UPI003F51660C
MWCDTQDHPFAMGLRGTANKRKLSEADASASLVAMPHSSKVVRTDDWESEIQYSPAATSGGRSYQCYNTLPPSPAVSPLPVSAVNGNPGDEYHRSCYEVQQTIRCDENGKSYLDLGSWNTRNNVNNRCCEARTSWCTRGPSCYRQKRLAVLNISMCKLGRYRQFSDPSLHRSVLICNTLRLIEKEMEQEGYFNSSVGNTMQPPVAPPEPLHQQFPEVPVPYEPPRVPTPFPPPVTDSEDDRSINWGSVLSLSSQSDLDPLNNNDCLGDSDLSHDLDDFLPSWKMTDDALRPVATRASDSGELDNIMHVLVGT